MAFTTVPTYVTNQLVTASHANTYWRNNLNALFPYTAIGDISYASALDTLSALPIGSGNQILQVDPSTLLPKWNSSGHVIIDDQILSSAADEIIFDSIPATFRELELKWYARDSYAAYDTLFRIQINDLSTSVYDNLRTLIRYLEGVGAIPITVTESRGDSYGFFANISGSSAPADYPSGGTVLFRNPGDTTFYKQIRAWSENIRTRSLQNFYNYHFSTFCQTKDAVSKIKLFYGAGHNFVAGSRFTLYGVY